MQIELNILSGNADLIINQNSTTSKIEIINNISTIQ